MFVSPVFTSKYGIRPETELRVHGGPLDGMIVHVVQLGPLRSKGINLNVDYENIYGRSIELKGGKFLVEYPMPKTGGDGDRFTGLLIGSSGAGKTRTCLTYIYNFRRMFPNTVKNPVYWISIAPCDSKKAKKLLGTSTVTVNPTTMEPIVTYRDPLMNTIRITRDSDFERYFLNPHTKLGIYEDDRNGNFYGNLSSALVVVDDVENIPEDRKVLLDNLLSCIMNLGRHTCTSLIWCRHELGGHTSLARKSLKEIKYIGIFNAGGNDIEKYNKNFLGNLKGLPKFVKANCNTHTMIYNRAPKFLLTDTGKAMILP